MMTAEMGHLCNHPVMSGEMRGPVRLLRGNRKRSPSPHDWWKTTALKSYLRYYQPIGESGGHAVEFIPLAKWCYLLPRR